MHLIKITKKEIKLTLKEQSGHWKLFIWMFLYTLIPTIWVLLRTIVITQYMEASVLTYAQWDYLNIMLEVIQETIAFPLFWWFGKIIVNDINHLNKIREVYMITFLLYLTLITILSFFVGDLVNILGSKEGYQQKTFFLLQLWSKTPAILTTVSTVILLNLKMYKGFLLLLITKVGLAILFDFTLTNKQVFDNSYIGLGISTLLTEVFLFIVSLMLIAKAFTFKTFFKIKTLSFNFKEWNFTKIFWSNVLAAFLFSTINNVFYLFMMAKNMNASNGSDAYWLSNTVIWSWILIIANVIFSIKKSIVSTTDSFTYKKYLIMILEFQIISIVALLIMMAIFIPIYKPFALFLSGNNQDLMKRSWIIFSNQIGFFVFFVLSTSINALFNGKGKNWILTIQALISNLLTFIPFIILHLSGKLVYSTEILTLMFGFSLMVSWIVAITFISGFLIIKKKNFNANFII